MRRIFSSLASFYWGNAIPDEAPALTYFLIVCQAPFIIGVTALAGLVSRGALSTTDLAEQIAHYAPPQIRSDLLALVLRVQNESTLLLVLSVFLMMWTLAGAIGVLERCMARVLDRPRLGMIVGKLRHLALGGAMAVMIISLVGLGSLVSGAGSLVGVDAVSLNWALINAGALGAILVCALVYRFAVRGHIAWRAALAGALPAGLALQAVPLIIAWYVPLLAGARVTTQLIFTLAIILISFSLMAQILLIGSTLAAVVEKRLARSPDDDLAAIADGLGEELFHQPRDEEE